MTRLSRVGWVRFPHSPATAVWLPAIILALLGSGVPRTAESQETPNTVIGIGGRPVCLPPTDTGSTVQGPRVMIAGERESQLPVCRVPISPRAALLRSFLVPGLGQLQLERPRAAAFFAIIEVGSIGMTVKSLRDLRLSKDARADTIATPVLDPVTGEPALDPATGEPRVTWAPRNPVIADRVRARRTHLEDWMAVVVFNHLISGADAFVAAYLADFNTNVQISAAGPRDLSVAAKVFW